MIVVTSENIAGKRVVKTLGMVRGSTVRAAHVGRDLLAFLRNLVGGKSRSTRRCWPRRGNRPSTG